MSEYYVYLKTNVYSANNLTGSNIIPLRVNTVNIGVQKSNPSFNVPFSGLVTGESETIALDLGMASKTVQLSGFINDTTLKRQFKDDDTPRILEFTAQETAQLIASGVDSTGIAEYQAFSELVILIPSNVDSNYVMRSSGIGSLGELIPFNFASRGGANSLDNTLVPLPTSTFPDSQSHKGISGFISSFDFTLDGETTEIAFNMTFELAAPLIP
tara:strand:+ start:131 stop:772 length:642 start_codon:yes stop_codon:yes gene_type:complete